MKAQTQHQKKTVFRIKRGPLNRCPWQCLLQSAKCISLSPVMHCFVLSTTGFVRSGPVADRGCYLDITTDKFSFPLHPFVFPSSLYLSVSSQFCRFRRLSWDLGPWLTVDATTTSALTIPHASSTTQGRARYGMWCETFVQDFVSVELWQVRLRTLP